MPTSAAALHASLGKHNATFESLLRLIPAKFYLVQDDDDDQSSKYHKNKRSKQAPKQAIKEASKKARREKLDPANNKSILDIQNERASASARAKKGKAKQAQKPAADDADDDDEDGAADVALDVDLSASDDVNDDNELDGGEAAEIVPMPESQSIDALRAKLHARMSTLRNRGRRPPGEYPQDVGSRDELLEERRQQRAAMRERRRKETREKIRREEEQRGKKGKDKDKGRDKAQTTKTQLLVPDRPPSSRPAPDPKSTFTNITFSTLATPADGPSSSSKKAHQRLTTSANPTQALAQLAARKERLAALPTDKRRQIEERERWQKAEARMEGVKVRDDEARLKKAAKKGEKEKGKSKKSWDERKEQIGAAMAARQKKRTDNIAQRNERRSDKRKGVKPKASSKARPGFEGKAFGKGKGKKKGK